MIRRFLIPALLLSSLSLPVLAQDAPVTTPPVTTPPATSSPAAPQTADGAEQSNRDRDWLTGLIEDKLSGEGRQIRLDGFKGAFSSKATFDALTISDADGPWLTIRNGAMSWSRSALLTGKIEIAELSAAEIDLARLPAATTDTEAPSPEAKPFQLPELPVSVNIGKISAAKVSLGESVIGQAVTFSLDGNVSLSGGDGKAKLSMVRTDGTKGAYSFDGGYANGSRQLAVDLLVDEGQGGLVSTLSKLPGSPALTLAVAGSGPLDAFSSDVVLSTDGQPRIKGKVNLTAVAAAADGSTAEKGQGFSVNLSGDITPMLPAEYRDFFGTNSQVVATGVKMPDGSFTLSDLTLDSQALDIKGRLATLPSGMPDTFSLDLKLGEEGGQDILLPVSGAETWVRNAALKLFYDRNQGQGWTLSGVLSGLRRDTMQIGQVRLAGNGLVSLATQTNAASGRVNFDVSDIALKDPALAEAVGTALNGSTVFDWTETHPLNMTNLVVNGRDLALQGGVSIDNLSSGVDIMPDLVLDARDLSHYAGVAGRPLAGAVQGTVKGKLTALTGAFDLTASLTGQDLKSGVAEADALLSGTSQIEASAARDDKGLTIREFSANAKTLSATASGVLATGASDLKAQIQLTDLGSLGGRYRGSANLTASILDTEGETRYSVDGTASNLALGQDLADKLLAGNTKLMARAATRNGVTRLTALNLQNPQLTATAESAGDTTVKLNARLANIGLLTPKYTGPVTAEGTIGQQGKNYALDLKAAGPGGIQATVNGIVAGDGSNSNLSIKGHADTALANNFIDPQSVEGTVNFDLRMQGKPGLNALSGTIQAPNANLNIPAATLALQNINLKATLGDGRITLDTRAAMKGGGTMTLTGPVALTAPFQSNLKLTLAQARLRNPELYDTRISGALSVAGPLTGNAAITGRLTLGTTEIRVPDSLGGSAAIPDITHRATPAKVTKTLSRAGLLGEAGAEGGSGTKIAYRMDVTIDAPNQIFVRGRGLDAELGGSLRLTGTTANIVPIGHFSLIRGRLDILAKRFTLSDGQVAMQGTMTPWISFSATTQQSDTTVTIKIEGEATAPQLTLSSSPELPDDEVLARLLFNKGLTTLSALQAAQLASAVATLAGKGGEGMISKLRNEFGFDDLDVGTDDEGNASLRAGKYIAKDVYSDVAINSEGKTELNLNFDINKNVTARGTVGSDGDSSVGLFFEKDY